MTDLNRTSRARLELRDAGNGMITLSGYASVFDKPYLVGEFEEVVRPGAFRRSLNSKPGPDVLLNVNHGAAGGLPLARTGVGSLRLREDDHGLAFEADLDPEDSESASLARKVKSGLATAMSFAFRVMGEAGQRWSDDFKHRELLAVNLNLGDVSVVAHPASLATSVTVRARGPLAARSVLPDFTTAAARDLAALRGGRPGRRCADPLAAIERERQRQDVLRLRRA